MRVLRRVLVGVGVALMALYALINWVGSSSSRFAHAQGPFINQFVADLSQRWELRDVSDRVSVSFERQADSAEGQRQLARFRLLGSLRSISGLQLQRYVLSNDISSGLFSLHAEFAHGGAQVQITLSQRGDGVRVESLYLSPLTPAVNPDLPQIET